MIALAAALLIFLGSVTPNVLADSLQNNYLTNGTGKTATDLEMWLVGEVLLSDVFQSPFRDLSYSYDSSENITKIRWYNGSVANGQQANVCFWTNTPGITHRYIPRWSFDAAPGIVIGPVVSHNFETATTGAVNVNFSNTLKDGGPITIGVIQVGPTDTIYPLEKLTWANLETIKWTVTKNFIPLFVGGSVTFNSIPLTSKKGGIVYRARLWLDSDPKNVVECIGEFIP